MNLRTIEKLCDPLEGGHHQKTPALSYISQMLHLIGLTLSGLTLLESCCGWEGDLITLELWTSKNVFILFS